jgi:glucoamylase
MSALEEWIAFQARFATSRMLRAISATDLVLERTGFGQRVVPVPGSVLASPVPAHYDPDPDYFFHWFRDGAIVIDALRVALAAGYAERSAVNRFREFVQFSLSLQALDGREALRSRGLRTRVQPGFLQYLRPDAELSALSAQAILGDTRVNADGTPDFIRWSRPQYDGPAIQAITLLRWWQQVPDLHAHPALQTSLSELIRAELAFTLAHVHDASSDIWEESSGYHYYTQLLQAEALRRGAEWLEHIGERDRAAAVRSAAAETLARLDGFWVRSAGFYRSQERSAAHETAPRLDIAVVLGVLHAGRISGSHSVLDPKTQATLTALEELFEARYAINRDRPPGHAPALGRYAGDRYYGGGAWFLATLAAAEFYFKLAQALHSGANMSFAPENSRFRERLGAAETAADGTELARLAVARGDALMRTVRLYTPKDGALSEQFDQTTGAPSSAKHLSWSYAAFITAAASRQLACRPTPDAVPPMKPAGTA